MNLATLVTNIDDLKDLADFMHLPRRIATLLLSTYKPVIVTMLQLCTSSSYHMLIVQYWSEMGDEFRKLCNLQKIFDFFWDLDQNVWTLCPAMAMVLWTQA